MAAYDGRKGCHMLELSHTLFCKTRGECIIPAVTIKGPCAGVNVGLEEQCKPRGDLKAFNEVPA